jgi:hypothetical protein
MDKHLAQHWTQEQGSRIATAAHLNYEFATIRRLAPAADAERSATES